MKIFIAEVVADMQQLHLEQAIQDKDCLACNSKTVDLLEHVIC